MIYGTFPCSDGRQGDGPAKADTFASPSPTKEQAGELNLQQMDHARKKVDSLHSRLFFFKLYMVRYDYVGFNLQ